jgi:hypothetical protein
MIYEILNGETVVNTIVADAEFMAANYPAGNYREAPEPVPIPTPRHITVGAFFDRFGEHKWPILADTNPSVQALVKDARVRTYINLDDPQVRAGLNMVVSAGHNIDVDKVILAPIKPNESV